MSEEKKRKFKLTKEIVAGVFTFLLLGAIIIFSSNESADITGNSIFDDLREALDTTNQDKIEQAEQAAAENPCADGDCDFGNIPIRFTGGQVREIDGEEHTTPLFVSSNPKHGSTINNLEEVTVTASQKLLAGSYIKLYKDNKNTQVDQGYSIIEGNTIKTNSLLFWKEDDIHSTIR